MSIQQAPAPQGQMSGQVMFYDRPEPLSPEQHGKLKIRNIERPFDFAAQAHIVPLQVTEFGPASLSYPVIFVGEPKTPMAVLGLRQNDNLFVDAKGQWESLAYVPGFIRRYPFVLADNGREEQLIVCLDRNAPMLGEDGEGQALFENGQLSDFAKSAVEFCSNFETERRRTDQFVARLKELDLFESKQATFTPRNADGSMGPPSALADYFAVSEEKVTALGDAELRELNSSGALRQIALHLNSMLNWERLVGRAALRPSPVAGHA